MAKKISAKNRSKSSLTVVSPQGRQPFLRGVITHELMQRGLEFDDAYAVAHAVKGQLADQTEVSSEELWDLILELTEATFGADMARKVSLGAVAAPPAGIVVIRGDHKQPFSRGLLARSLSGAGLDLDRAYRHVMTLESELRAEGVDQLDSGDLALRVADLLQRVEGKEAAHRYRMVRRVHRLSKPIAIYIGGASGTGKSTLALDLAPMLRIYRVIATDTIRQVMRMVFSPQILPVIHGSSFAASQLPFYDEEDDPSNALLNAFQEQAVRVGVGVKAVVERAVTEGHSILVEGVHLLPPVVPFPDLESSCYQVPLMLATPDAEVHRRRFFARTRQGQRVAERYIESFESIRLLHEFMLEQAESEDIPLISTTGGDAPVESLRVITTLLRRRLPKGLFEATIKIHRAPTVLLIIDGLADRPVRALGGRTPLEAADTPNLDRLAAEGQVGLADPVAPGVVPDTAAGSLALFGQSPAALKRGPVEAVGAGLKLKMHDIALRANFATFGEDGSVLDRRAGRIREDAEELAEALDSMTLPRGRFEGVKIVVRAATEHRLAVVLRGEGLSSAILGSDPGDGAAPCRAQVPRPVDPNDARAVLTARLLALFELEARKVLSEHPINRRRVKEGLPPANGILSRGAGRIHLLNPLEVRGQALRLACVGGDRTVLGLAKWLGAEIVHEPGMTANLDTNLELKLSRAREILVDKDLVIVHMKGADIAAHDRRPDLKAGFLERIDQALGKELLDQWEGPLRIAVSGDHATLSESGQHAADPLPVVIWGDSLDPDPVTVFNESAVVGGVLGRFPLQLMLSRLFELD